MLKLRRAPVIDASPPGAAKSGGQRLTVELGPLGSGPAGESAAATGEGAAPREPSERRYPMTGHRQAIADIALVGSSHRGDEVIVNVEALDLGLGSGGFDVVHANLTRGLQDSGASSRN